jgi:hypothetical protein
LIFRPEPEVRDESKQVNLDEVQHKKEDTEFIRQLNIHQLNIPQIQ